MKAMMSLMMRRIETRWQALEPAPDKPIFQLLDAEHPLKLYIGREITGEYLFLLVDPDQPPKLKGLRSVRISSIKRSDGQWSLLLSLTHTELAGVFALLCEDLVESSRHLARGDSGVKLVSRRLANWRRLLEEGGSGLLSSAEVRGLVGELLVLDCYFLDRLGPGDAVNAWGGPLGSDQDFQMVDEAWEVKTIYPDSPAIQIASETQLDSPSRKINLTVIPLDEVGGDSGYSLNGLVTRLKARMEDQPMAQDAFDDRLVALGYMTRSEYDSPRFKAGKARTFQVHGEFPRIVAKDLIKGVTEVKYKVQLDACAPFEIETPYTAA
jgi:hypothetical protein